MSFINGSSTFAIITGASRGIGRAIAIQLATKVGPSSVIHLIARSEEGLKETAKIVKKEAKEEVNVVCFPSDLSKDEDVQHLTQALFKDIGDASNFAHVVLMHNAAALTDVGKYARDFHDAKFLQNYFMLTFTSPIILTTAVLKHFREFEGVRKTVVQMTSFAGLHPIQTLHLYGMGKAGRDMFFKVMALEEPEVRIMTYDPGFVDTNMFDQLYGTADDTLKVFSENISSNKSIFLTPEQSAEALVKALEQGKYESGATVRSYDVLNIDVDSRLKHYLSPQL